MHRSRLFSAWSLYWYGSIDAVRKSVYVSISGGTDHGAAPGDRGLAWVGGGAQTLWRRDMHASLGGTTPAGGVPTTAGVSPWPERPGGNFLS